MPYICGACCAQLPYLGAAFALRRACAALSLASPLRTLQGIATMPGMYLSLACLVWLSSHL